MGLDGVHHPHDVPDTLADEGAPHEEGFQGGADAGGALLGAAALTEGSLLDGQSREALGYGADAEVAVAARDGVLVTGVLGHTQRDVGTLGVALEGGAEGELPRLGLGEEEIAMGEVALLGLEGEVDVAVAAVLALVGDLKNGVTGGEGIQTQQSGELFGAGLAVGVDGGLTVPAEGGGEGFREGDVVDVGLGIHGKILLNGGRFAGWTDGTRVTRFSGGHSPPRDPSRRGVRS